MSREFGVVWLQRWREGERDLVVADDVRAELTVASLQALLKHSHNKVKRQKYQDTRIVISNRSLFVRKSEMR